MTGQCSLGKKSREGTVESFGDGRHIHNHLDYDHDFNV